MDNHTRRSDPVYDFKREQAHAREALSPAPSSPAPAPVEMAQGSTDSGAVRAIWPSPRDSVTFPVNALYGADISGTLDKDEKEFVTTVMQLATGAHSFAAIRMLTLAIVELRRDSHIEAVGAPPEVMTIGDEPVDDNAAVWGRGHSATMGAQLTYPDTRKPWVEPTVTECATTNRRPATLTIAGVDLPNPAPPAPSIAPTADEIHNAVVWLRQRASMQPGRSGEFEVVARIMEGVAAAIDRTAPAPISIDVTKLLNDLEKQARWIGGEEYSEDTGWRCGAKGLDGKGYAADMRAASAEIQRQAAEIAELQGLLKEATPVAWHAPTCSGCSAAGCPAQWIGGAPVERCDACDCLPPLPHQVG